MSEPPPIGVILPVDPDHIDRAEMALRSVFRQLYPHWQLLVVWPSGPVPEVLVEAARMDARVRFVSGQLDDQLGRALESALRDFACQHVVVLHPEWELREHALFRFAEAVRVGVNVVTSEELGDRAAVRLGVLPVSLLRFSKDLAQARTPREIVERAAELVPMGGRMRHLDEALARRQSDSVAAAQKPTGSPLFLAGDIVRIGGYDLFLYAFLKELSAMGTNVCRQPDSVFRNDLVPPHLRPPCSLRGPHEAQLIATNPLLLHRFPPDARSAVYTMWETERLEPSWVRHLNRAAVVMVPSAWGRDCFRQNGVKAPIEVVPLGCDVETFHPGPTRPEECVFGTAGALDLGGVRKNVQKVVNLFRKAFPTERDVRLRVKLTPASPPIDDHGDRRVEVLSAFLSIEELAAWCRSLTVFVNASHAEGFGLHLLETMACGRALISTTYSGVGSFFDSAVGYDVPYSLVESRNRVYSGRWAEPDYEAMIAQMRQVYRDPDEARRLGELAAERARQFTWRESAQKLAAVLVRYGLMDRGG